MQSRRQGWGEMKVTAEADHVASAAPESGLNKVIVQALGELRRTAL